MAKRKKTVRYRRADTGRYCSARYAKKHPKTTIREVR
jgi:hypothetical protein